MGEKSPTPSPNVGGYVAPQLLPALRGGGWGTHNRGEGIMQTAALDTIIEMAFTAGQDWAETYHGWFTPEPEDHTVRLEECKSKIRKWVKHNRLVLKGLEEE